jgi:iron complex transport system permease protein
VIARTGSARSAAAPHRRREPAGTRKLSSGQYTALVAGLIVALLASTLLAISLGTVDVPLDHSWRIVASHLAPGRIEPIWSTTEETIVWTFRMPRAILAILVGAGLALVGVVLQALVRNPLADPYLLGISSGASFGAVAVLVLGSAAFGGLTLSAAAFAGAMLATGALYVLAQRYGHVSPLRLILAGVALDYLFRAAYSYILQQATFGQAYATVLFWLLGSLAAARWDLLTIPTVVLVTGMGFLLLQARPLNALLAGEETAVALGIHLGRLRTGLFVATAVLVGVMVAVSGAIAFVGLIVPHMCRMVVGADHRRLLLVSALGGATFLQLADLASRLVDKPREQPLSIVTAAVGVPFFLWLLRRESRSNRLSVA